MLANKLENPTAGFTGAPIIIAPPFNGNTVLIKGSADPGSIINLHPEGSSS